MMTRNEAKHIRIWDEVTFGCAKMCVLGIIHSDSNEPNPERLPKFLTGIGMMPYFVYSLVDEK